MFKTHVHTITGGAAGQWACRQTLARLLKAAAAYFALVFGTGFVLGMIRVPFIVPRFGARAAELMETPLMLAAIVLAARWTVRRFDLRSAPLTSVFVGLIALVLLLAVEFTVVLWLQGMTFAEYWERRDPVSGTVYFMSLAVFVALPWLITRLTKSA